MNAVRRRAGRAVGSWCSGVAVMKPRRRTDRRDLGDGKTARRAPLSCSHPLRAFGWPRCCRAPSGCQTRTPRVGCRTGACQRTALPQHGALTLARAVLAKLRSCGHVAAWVRVALERLLGDSRHTRMLRSVSRHGGAAPLERHQCQPQDREPRAHRESLAAASRPPAYVPATQCTPSALSPPPDATPPACGRRPRARPPRLRPAPPSPHAGPAS